MQSGIQSNPSAPLRFPTGIEHRTELPILLVPLLPFPRQGSKENLPVARKWRLSRYSTFEMRKNRRCIHCDPLRIFSHLENRRAAQDLPPQQGWIFLASLELGAESARCSASHFDHSGVRSPPGEPLRFPAGIEVQTELPILPVPLLLSPR
jgi:hypothetical protein